MSITEAGICGIVILWLDTLILSASIVTLAYGLYKAHRGPGIRVLLTESTRARKLFSAALLCLFVAGVVVLVYPFPPEPYYVRRALLTYVPFVAIEMILMSMFVDAAETIRRGGRRKTD